MKLIAESFKILYVSSGSPNLLHYRRGLGTLGILELNPGGKEDVEIIRIRAIIYVERDSQKAIVIGQGGSRLKNIGQQCRGYLEMYFEKSIYIDLWVKVKKGWSDNVDQLSRLGYDD